MVNYITSLYLELHTRVHIHTAIPALRGLRWERFRVNLGNVMTKELILTSADKRRSYYVGCS